jgi:hypothetical protein
MALHAKAKAEPGFRFYALYDKISRDDILAHAWVQCRSNQGAPGVDGKDFADIETYGAERWLGELALALKEEKYRPDAIRRVFIPKARILECERRTVADRARGEVRITFIVRNEILRMRSLNAKCLRISDASRYWYADIVFFGTSCRS